MAQISGVKFKYSYATPTRFVYKDGLTQNLLTLYLSKTHSGTYQMTANLEDEKNAVLVRFMNEGRLVRTS